MTRRDLGRRLTRAEISAAAIPWADRKVVRHRQSLRVQVSLCDLVRQRLQAMGIDPKCAIALRLGERAAAELAGIPDTPELRASNAAPPIGPNSSEAKDRLDREVARIADRMLERFGRGEEPVDLANASLVELLAFGQQTHIHNLVRNLLLDDQLVLGIDRDLHVVAVLPRQAAAPHGRESPTLGAEAGGRRRPKR